MSGLTIVRSDSRPQLLHATDPVNDVFECLEDEALGITRGHTLGLETAARRLVGRMSRDELGLLSEHLSQTDFAPIPPTRDILEDDSQLHIWAINFLVPPAVALIRERADQVRTSNVAPLPVADPLPLAA